MVWLNCGAPFVCFVSRKTTNAWVHSLIAEDLAYSFPRGQQVNHKDSRELNIDVHEVTHIRKGDGNTVMMTSLLPLKSYWM